MGDVRQQPKEHRKATVVWGYSYAGPGPTWRCPFCGELVVKEAYPEHIKGHRERQMAMMEILGD